MDPKRLILRWIAAAAAVWIAAWAVDGIHVEGGIAGLFAVALILGLVNALVRPLVVRLACGVIALTLGLFLLVINALMLLLAELLARAVGVGFSIDGFIPALLGALVISIISFFSSLILSGRTRGGRRRK